MLRDAETTSIAERMRRSPRGGDAFSPPPRRRTRFFFLLTKHICLESLGLQKLRSRPCPFRLALLFVASRQKIIAFSFHRVSRLGKGNYDRDTTYRVIRPCRASNRNQRTCAAHLIATRTSHHGHYEFTCENSSAPIITRGMPLSPQKAAQRSSRGVWDGR